MPLPIKAAVSPTKHLPKVAKVKSVTPKLENIPPRGTTTIQIDVPGPAPPFRKKPNEAYYLSEEGRSELLSLLSPAEKPYQPLIGDVKLTLDDLKCSVLDYYSRLYALQGATINERIGELQRSHWPSPLVETPQPPPPPGRIGTSHGDLIERRSSPQGGTAYRPVPEVFVGDMPPHRAGELSQYPAAGSPYGDAVLPSPVFYNGQNFFGTLQPVIAPQPAALMQQRLKEAGLQPVPDPREGNSLRPLGSSISDVMTDLHRAAEGATRKLDGISNRLYNTTENVDHVGWAYAAAPGLRRRPRLTGAPELERAIGDLYAHMYRQVKFNDKRIRALRSRLNLLMRECPAAGDPRNAL